MTASSSERPVSSSWPGSPIEIQRGGAVRSLAQRDDVTAWIIIVHRCNNATISTPPRITTT